MAGVLAITEPMPEYVEPAVRDLCERDSENIIDILLGVSGDRKEFAENIQQLDSRIEKPEQVGRTSLRVSTPIEIIDTICEMDETKSIEVDEQDVETYTKFSGDQGNV